MEELNVQFKFWSKNYLWQFYSFKSKQKELVALFVHLDVLDNPSVTSKPEENKKVVWNVGSNLSLTETSCHIHKLLRMKTSNNFILFNFVSWLDQNNGLQNWQGYYRNDFSTEYWSRVVCLLSKKLIIGMKSMDERQKFSFSFS